MDGNSSRPSRRRFISVSAASAAMLLAGPAAASARYFTWRGVALGAESQIRLVHQSPGHARSTLNSCIAEIERLENIFSLYRPNSTLSVLNRDGEVEEPEAELVQLLTDARQISQETQGAFDVSVQPLWELFASRSPKAAEIEAALDLVGYEDVDASTQRIRLKRPGMKLTLNGIAQGFITDRIAGLLQRSGFADVLVHLGETYGAGSKPGGVPWRASIEGTRETLDLSALALATSGTVNTTSMMHLFDPQTGIPAGFYETVSVAAPTATVADALSTAFCVMEKQDILHVLSRRPNTSATLVNKAGQVLRL